MPGSPCYFPHRVLPDVSPTEITTVLRMFMGRCTSVMAAVMAARMPHYRRGRCGGTRLEAIFARPASPAGLSPIEGLTGGTLPQKLAGKRGPAIVAVSIAREH